MSFPETRLTLIQRIAVGGENDDWQQFLGDYWRPVCRFASTWGNLNPDDAEDVAAALFEVLIRGDLLKRWSSTRNSKVRTLLCGVVRNLLANRHRLTSGRERLIRENRELFQHLAATSPAEGPAVESAQSEAFYAAWVEELLQDAIELLQEEYLKSGRGDHFRVLYGRICEGLSTPEIAKHLRLETSAAENCYKHAKKRLGEILEQVTRERIARYSAPAEFEMEFEAEWRELAEHLLSSGGLEECLRKSYHSFDSTAIRQHEHHSVIMTLSRIDRQKLSGSDALPPSV